ILHNSPSGAVERIIYALLEKAAADIKKGKKTEFPLWLAPTQVRIISVKPEFFNYCEGLADKISSSDIRVDIDERNESVAKRIRDSETEWIRYTLVVGEKEINSEKLNVRDRKTGEVREHVFDEFIGKVKNETKNKPFLPLNMTRRLSLRPQIMV
ncbi:MAG: His/Gly/Thr/Pro-type tRNA ligase C-terminal domain-containing protein, partial [Nitrosopumilaceae archaeon]